MGVKVSMYEFWGDTNMQSVALVLLLFKGSSNTQRFSDTVAKPLKYPNCPCVIVDIVVIIIILTQKHNLTSPPLNVI